MRLTLGVITRYSSVFVAVAMVGCLQGRVDVFSEEEFEVIKQFGPLGEVPPVATNKYADDPAAAALGQQFFFEKSFSHALQFPDTTLGKAGEAGKVSCSSCHSPKAYFSDARKLPTSLGVRYTSRNSPTIVNLAYYPFPGWAGKSDSLWAQGANGSESGANFSSNRLEFAHMVFRKYRAAYDALFDVPLDPALDPAAPDAARFPPSGKPKSSTGSDGPWEGMTEADQDHVNLIVANCGKAIAAYERLLVSRNAPIDRYIEGDYDALTASQKRGLDLFINKAACVDCHSGQLFSDYKYHNTGVAQIGVNLPTSDEGRFGDVKRTLSNTFNGAKKFSDDPVAGAAKIEGLEATEDQKGQFQTMSLRHIAETGPYMHTGGLKTLEDVVRWYNWGGDSSGFSGVKHPAMVPLHLTLQEEADLVAFMNALTGDPIPEELGEDTAIPD